MLSRICTVKTVHTAVMYMYEHACTLNPCPGYTVSSIKHEYIWQQCLYLVCMSNLQSLIISLLNDHAFCTNFVEFDDRSIYVNCRLFFFQFLIFFFQKEFSFELHAGNLFAIKEERSIYCSNATYVLLSQLSPYSIPLSDLSHVTQFLMFGRTCMKHF